MTLAAQAGGDPVEATIVGTMILPASINDTLTMGDGGVMTLEGLQAVYGPQGDASVAWASGSTRRSPPTRAGNGANTIAALPARQAARTHPAATLRSE